MAKRKTRKTKKSKKSFWSKLILYFVIALIAINVVENFIVVKSKYTISSDKFAGGFSGVNIVQLSDVHLVRNKWQYELLIRETKSAKPDIILLTGDLTDSRNYESQEYINLTIEFCKELVSIAPVYYVYGNHEVVLLNQKSFFEAISDAGVVTLNNLTDTVHINGGTINILGVQDPSYGSSVVKSATEKNAIVSEYISKVLTHIDTNNFTVLLAHRPECFDVYTNQYNIDLTFTGHAHGGQIRIPFTDYAVYAPGQGILPKYTSGVHESNGSYMIVSRGIGASRFPFRVFDTPEIVVVKLISNQ